MNFGKEQTMPITVRFYEARGTLLRIVTVDGKSFREQFDWDGWYSYSLEVFGEISEETAISLVLIALQTKHPSYKNPSRARFKLYDFSLSHLDQQLGSKISTQKTS